MLMPRRSGEALLEARRCGRSKGGRESRCRGRARWRRRRPAPARRGPAHPFAGAERALHRREDAAADQQGQRQRGRRAERIGEQQERWCRRWRPASAAPVRIRPRIGPAQGAQSRPVATPSRKDGPIRSCPAAASSADWDSRAPSATSGRVSRSASAGKQQRQAEQAEQDQRRPAAGLVGLHRPAAADRRQRRHQREGERHAGQQRQAAPQEGRSARAKTKGSTGRMQGLRMVRMPPR